MLTREQVQGFVERATAEEKRIYTNHFALAETALALYDENAVLKARVAGYKSVLDHIEIQKRLDRLEKLERVAEAAKKLASHLLCFTTYDPAYKTDLQERADETQAALGALEEKK